ncbi:MAG TPA: glycosyltransferase [Euzebya sp.]|nr:glycosyltransferase [Euzebya sp.]
MPSRRRAARTTPGGPLSVVHIIARLNVGGPARLLDTLMRHTDPDEVRITVLAGAVGAGEADYRDLVAPMAVQAIASLGPTPRPGSDLRALAELTTTLRRLAPDVVHTHTAKAGVLGRLAARAAGVPRRVHTYHGHLLSGYFRPAVSTAITVSERLLARDTHRLVAIGTAVRDDLLVAGVGRADQWEVHLPGVIQPPHVDRRVARATLGLPEDVPVVGFVGRLASIKRPDRLAAAILELAATRPGLHAVIAGDGPMRAEMVSLLAPVSGRVRVLGWHPQPHLVYAASDLVLLSSDNEGVPLTLAEAALMGVPAVSTDVGGVRDVVVDGVTGILTECSVAGLVAGAQALLDDAPRRLRMGSAARTHAQQRLSIDQMVDAHMCLYRRALTSRH